MSGGHRVTAELILSPTEAGGISGPLPSGTRSLLLVFAPNVEGTQERVSIGAVITAVNGEPLQPGASNVEVELHFWSDEARIYATSGVRFALWYGRLVGEGVILQQLDDVAD